MSNQQQQQQQQNCRWGEVILLDGRSVEILIQVFLVNNLITDWLLDISIFFLILKNKPRLFAGDLFDTVATHFDLKEKEFFGLAFLDETYVFGFVFFFRWLIFFFRSIWITYTVHIVVNIIGWISKNVYWNMNMHKIVLYHHVLFGNNDNINNFHHNQRQNYQQQKLRIIVIVLTINTNNQNRWW